MLRYSACNLNTVLCGTKLGKLLKKDFKLLHSHNKLYYYTRGALVQHCVTATSPM